MQNYNKTNYIQGQVADGNKKQLFKIVTSLLGKNQDNPMPKHTNNKELAEEIADFFLNKILNIRHQFEGIDEYKTHKEDIPQFRKFPPISASQLDKLIHSINSKTCELDQIPTKRSKEVYKTIRTGLLHIINLSLENSEFTKNWKEALVKPLIKKRSGQLVKSNYRPVSNLQFISKLIEKVTLEQLADHCETRGLLPDFQSAYRPNHSCEMSLVKLVNDILWSMEHGNITALVIMDLSAAFDTIDHDQLLEILDKKNS